MRDIRRIFNIAVLLILSNAVFLWNLLQISMLMKILCIMVLATAYIIIAFLPINAKGKQLKLLNLGAGCEMLLMSAIVTAAQLALHLTVFQSYEFSAAVWIGNLAVTAALLIVTLANGLVRLFFASGQIRLSHRLFVVFLWWVPVVNLFVFCAVWRVANREYRFECLRLKRNDERREQAVCGTKYPLLFVHGIFFRDWKYVNYWGRIPKELEGNGARIFYGNQHSSSSVESSAEELKKRIFEVLEESGAEKVNIIAHSKGGIDSRYAISVLGMDKYVASLTTVNTPHRGCRFARKALDGLPPSLVSAVSGKYDRIFSRLGDDTPDFWSGVSDLTDEKCARLNELSPDCEGVYYRSIGSKMYNARSAGFPLNLGWGIVNAVDGENDGLVAVPSMPWGEFTLWACPGRTGISHGDVIDLMRRDVPGFDVREMYVGLVSDLKNKGL